jgi:hypothetical protein
MTSLCLGVPVLAQANSGTITGMVTDHNQGLFKTRLANTF